MSGHSKWATIKRKKGETDAKKGKVFTKLVREITTAARLGGGDVSGNPRLRVAIAAAKADRMPADNIDRAIKKGTGDLDGPPVEELAYEGYGPGGVALLIEAQTDNRNRTVSEVRTAFTKLGGSLGAAGSVAYLFQKRGLIWLTAAGCDEDTVMELALDAGADDVRAADDGQLLVDCPPAAFVPVLDAIEARGLTAARAELTMVPDTHVPVAGEDAQRLVRLIERLEDLDDVQKVHANGDFDEAELERLG